MDLSISYRFSLICTFLLVVCAGFSPIGHYGRRELLKFYSSSASEGEGEVMLPPPVDFSNAFVSKEVISFHHTCIKTRDIVAAIKFYGILGFRLDRKFMLPGSVRAAWMKHAQNPSQKLEFIEIPKWNLNESPGSRLQAIDVLDPKYYRILGYNHIALDVTDSMRAKNMTSLCDWISDLNQTSISVYNKHIQSALRCKETAIGQSIYDLAMIRDPDGCLVEFVHYKTEFENEMLPDW